MEQIFHQHADAQQLRTTGGTLLVTMPVQSSCAFSICLVICSIVPFASREFASNRWQGFPLMFSVQKNKAQDVA